MKLPEYEYVNALRVDTTRFRGWDVQVFVYDDRVLVSAMGLSIVAGLHWSAITNRYRNLGLDACMAKVRHVPEVSRATTNLVVTRERSPVANPFKDTRLAVYLDKAEAVLDALGSRNPHSREWLRMQQLTYGLLPSRIVSASGSAEAKTVMPRALSSTKPIQEKEMMSLTTTLETPVGVMVPGPRPNPRFGVNHAPRNAVAPVPIANVFEYADCVHGVVTHEPTSTAVPYFVTGDKVMFGATAIGLVCGYSKNYFHTLRNSYPEFTKSFGQVQNVPVEAGLGSTVNVLTTKSLEHLAANAGMKRQTATALTWMASVAKDLAVPTPAPVTAQEKTVPASTATAKPVAKSEMLVEAETVIDGIAFRVYVFENATYLASTTVSVLAGFNPSYINHPDNVGAVAVKDLITTLTGFSGRTGSRLAFDLEDLDAVFDILGFDEAKASAYEKFLQTPLEAIPPVTTRRQKSSPTTALFSQPEYVVEIESQASTEVSVSFEPKTLELAPIPKKDNAVVAFFKRLLRLGA